MLIVCPNCATSYQVEPVSLGQSGRSVRCARCQNVWFAAPVLVSAGADDWDVVDTGPLVPSVKSPPTAPAAEAADPALAAASGGIDVSGLSAEMDSERAEREAEADAVLAEVAHENASEPAPEPPSPQTVPPGADVETIAARRARRGASRRGHWFTSGMSAAILLLIAANVSVLLWRKDIVRLMPQTAPVYAAIGLPVNLRGLAFEDIRMSRAEHEGVDVLVVEGSIVNITARPLEVPRLRLAVRNEARYEVYSWTAKPSRTILAPGDVLPFRSRLASPPADAREVQVRFFSKRDLVAGLN